MVDQVINKTYWHHNIDSLIDKKILECKACEANSDTTSFHPIISSKMPDEKSWDMVAIDFSSRTPTGEYILVLVCEHSRYPVLKLSSGLKSRDAIAILKKVFKEYGTPRHIKSDNGPAFISKEFSAFANEYGFIHVKVQPRWARANDMVERHMRCINKVIRCSKVDKRLWKLNFC